MNRFIAILLAGALGVACAPHLDQEPDVTRIDDEARDNLKDGFAHDMAEHQRVTGREVTPAANERLAAPFLEQLEQKLEERRERAYLRPAVHADERTDLDRAALKAECERRGRPHAADGLGIQRLPDKEPISVVTSPEDLERGMRMMRRLQLLLTKPEPLVSLGGKSWCEHALAVVALKMIKAPPNRTALALAELCEASIRHFGPWDQPEGEGRPLIFT